jgi:hypothetical protein
MAKQARQPRVTLIVVFELGVVGLAQHCGALTTHKHAKNDQRNWKRAKQTSQT